MCSRQGYVAALLAFVFAASAVAQAPSTAIPPQNQPGLREPPPRPPEHTVQASARALFDAIVQDAPSRAEGVFFPRDAFLLVKAMPHPERYYERLRRRFEADIRALHKATPELDKASFVRLELGRRGGFVKPGEEGNRLSYWAARHAQLLYRVGTQTRRLEVRVLITWGERWYVVHLNDF